ncbi:MAG: hypothetical protein GOP50_06920 [Candidatus Heimdallarchaeota archaeon]|nr:hypothetical protein [Candidatus Heimdallarchaeota archaeon]
MINELSVSQFGIAECSVDGEEWMDITEIATLCAINDHYCSKDHDSVLSHYNRGGIVPVEFVLYRKKDRARLI